MKFSKTIIRYILFIIVGSIGGYAYYHFIGCYSGTCPITSNPYLSILYGALIGFLLTPNRKKD